MDTRFAVLVGLDVGKSSHHACALDPAGNKLFDKPLPQDESELRELFTQLQNQGEVLMVVDQPKAIVTVEQLLSRQIGPLGREIVAVAGEIDRTEIDLRD